MRKNIYLPNRLDKRLDKESNPPHWIWLGPSYKNQKQTLASGLSGKTVSARRAVWELCHGEELTEDVYLIKNCEVPLCLSPDCTFLRQRGDVTATRLDLRRRYSDEQINRVKELLATGRYTSGYIIRHTGVAKNTVFRIKGMMKANEQ